jgi:ABC-type transport system involved in multi-copper enzyme maturation permease subunit
MIIVLLIASIPLLVRMAQIYIVSKLSDNTLFANLVKGFEVNSGFFAEFLYQQTFFVMIVTILTGAGLIANDRRSGALELYFSKPVSRVDYLLGKFVTVSFYCSLVTLFPALILFFAKVLLSENMSFFTRYYWVPFCILGYFLLVSLFVSGLVLALSAIGRGARFAGIGFFAIIWFSDVVKGILSSIPKAAAVSISSNLERISNLFFDQPPGVEIAGWLSLVILSVIIALCVLTIITRTGATDVVK